MDKMGMDKIGKNRLIDRSIHQSINQSINHSKPVLSANNILILLTRISVFAKERANGQMGGKAFRAI